MAENIKMGICCFNDVRACSHILQINDREDGARLQAHGIQQQSLSKLNVAFN